MRSPYTISEAWAARVTTDERGRPGAYIGLYGAESAAMQASDGRGFYKSRGHVEKVKVVFVEDRVFLLNEAFPEGLRIEQFDTNLIEDKETRTAAAKEKALSLLSDEERALLGIKF